MHAHKINQAEGDYVGKAPNYVYFKWVEMVKRRFVKNRILLYLYFVFAIYIFIDAHTEVNFCSNSSWLTVSVSLYQSASHCHSCARAHAEQGEQYAYISLFVTELYLRNRVSNHHVSASSRPTGSSVVTREVHDPVSESASKCFGFALWHKEFDDFSLFVLALSSSFHDVTA